MQSPGSLQHSTASSAQTSPAVHQPHLGAFTSFQPNLLAQVEDMLISPRFDTHSPHFRPFLQPADLQQVDVSSETDVASKRDQNRAKPRFSTSSLQDVDW